MASSVTQLLTDHCHPNRYPIQLHQCLEKKNTIFVKFAKRSEHDLAYSDSVHWRHAIPQQLTQQGRLIDTNGVAVDGQHVVSFKLYDALLGGQLIWEEPLVVIFNEGYYSAILGADVVNNPLDSSILATPGLHLEVDISIQDRQAHGKR